MKRGLLLLPCCPHAATGQVPRDFAYGIALVAEGTARSTR
jgi:hypothetical protein